jgi:hypothetical protein
MKSSCFWIAFSSRKCSQENVLFTNLLHFCNLTSKRSLFWIVCWLVCQEAKSSMRTYEWNWIKTNKSSEKMFGKGVTSYLIPWDFEPTPWLKIGFIKHVLYFRDTVWLFRTDQLIQSKLINKLRRFIFNLILKKYIKQRAYQLIIYRKWDIIPIPFIWSHFSCWFHFNHP